MNGYARSLMSEPQPCVSQALSSAIVSPQGREPVEDRYASADLLCALEARRARMANALPSSGWSGGPVGASRYAPVAGSENVALNGAVTVAARAFHDRASTALPVNDASDAASRRAST